jgi:hypothetical protein
MVDKSEAIYRPDPANVVSEDGALNMAFLRLNPSGSVTLNWASVFFDGTMPMPDVMREECIRVLRLHADGLESGDLERRIRGAMGIRGGTA